ncbi:T9SS type A sorting domain-containing protein [candidate division KSB1 bacterium]|nr:T9SS type A sorting domain-containing protein [candidate division KSB1 bacterium]
MQSTNFISLLTQNGKRSMPRKFKFYCASIIFIFLYTTNIFSQPGTTIAVSNAGTADCNGDYEMMAYVGERSMYLKDFPYGDILIYFNEGKWIIAKFDTSYNPPWPLLKTYYNNDAQTNNPPAGGWYSVSPDGMNPAPTLSGDGIEPGTAVSQISIQIPKEIALDPAYPNPFNPETQITYHLSENTYMKLSIVDIMGRTVLDLFKGTQSIGNYHSCWNGQDFYDNIVPSGTYFVVLKTTNACKIQKVLLLR